jgi:hypothetical protein
MPVTPFPIRAACRCRTRCLGGTSSALSPDELTRHGTQRRTRTGTTILLKDVPPAIGLAGYGASGRPRTRLPSRTKGTLCRVSYRGTGCPPWPRTRKLRNQSPALCLFELMGIRVRRQGLEPRLRHRLRACRSTIELAARRAVPGSRTPMICLEGKCLPVRPVRRGESRRYRTFLLQVFGPALIRLS